MGVGDYIRGLLPAPYRPPADGAGGQLIDAVGVAYDVADQAAYALRRAWVLATAEGLALDVHGRVRRTPRAAGELDDDYRARLLSAYLTGLASNTHAGMLALMASLGLPGDVYEHFHDPIPRFDGQYRYDGGIRYDGERRWAEFSLELEAVPSAEKLAQLLAGVARIKPAHARLARVVVPVGEGMVEDSGAILAATSGLLHVTITHTYDGSFQFDGAQEYQPEEQSHAF